MVNINRDKKDVGKRKKRRLLAAIIALAACLALAVIVEAKPSSLVQWNERNDVLLGDPHSSKDTASFYISDGDTTYKYTLSGLQGKKYFGVVGSGEVVNNLSCSGPQKVSSGAATFEAPSVKSVSLYPTATNAWIEEYGYYGSNGVWVSKYKQSHPEYKEWGSQPELKFHYGVSIELDTSKSRITAFKGSYKYGTSDSALCYNHSYDLDGNYWYWVADEYKSGVVTDKAECLKVPTSISLNRLEPLTLKATLYMSSGDDVEKEIPGIKWIGKESSLNTDSVTISGELQTFSGTEWVFNNGYMAQETDEAVFVFDIQPSTFNLTVNPNGGTWEGSSSQQSFTMNVGSTKNIPNPTRTGYTFTGWSLSGAGSSLDGTTFTMGNADATLTATWKVNSYKLTVNPNGGTWEGSASTQTFIMNYGGTKQIANPTRTGYTFTGWSLSGSGSTLSGTTFTMGYADATLTATWKVNSYKLTVNPNGGTWNSSASTQAFTMNYGGTKQIANPTRTGYTFTGWSLSGSGSTLNGTTFTMGYADATLTATWRINTSKLTINPNGGIWDGSSSVQSFTQNYNTTKSIPIPTRRGYTFTGWTKSNPFYGTMSSLTASATYTFGAADAVTSTITANWRANDYTLTLDHNKGNYNGASQNSYTVTYDSSNHSDISDKLPKRTGYTFSGYWTDKDSGTQVYTKEGKAINDNIHWKNGLWYKDGDATLYAHWTPNTYTLKFHPNEGGTVMPISDMVVTYDTAVNLPDGGLYYVKYTIDGENVTAAVLAGDVLPARSAAEAAEASEAEAAETSEDPVLLAEAEMLQQEIERLENERNDLLASGEAVAEEMLWLESEIDRLSMELAAYQYGAEPAAEEEMPKAYPSQFMGWVLEEERESLSPQWRAEQVSVNAIVETAGIADMNGSSVTLYAVWDDCPWIIAEDLYYTLEEAQSGFITHDELMSHASASDREDGSEIPPGEDSGKGTSFKVIDYLPEDFTGFQAEGSVTETYHVTDSAENIYEEMVTVHIVDSEPQKVLPVGMTRFINEKYYNETHENGGLAENSVWKTEPEYAASLREAFANERNGTPIKSFYFTYETIQEMKGFVEKNGFGKTKREDALRRFYDEFMAPNEVN